MSDPLIFYASLTNVVRRELGHFLPRERLHVPTLAIRDEARLQIRSESLMEAYQISSHINIVISYL